MQDLRRAVERNPFAIVGSMADMYQTISEGRGFALGDDTASDYHKKKYCWQWANEPNLRKVPLSTYSISQHAHRSMSNIRTFEIPELGSSHDTFPFRYDYPKSVRETIDRTILANFDALIRIQRRYRRAISAKNCTVKRISIGLFLS